MMNKKIPLIVLFIILVSWFVYRATHAPVSKNEVVIDSETSIAPHPNEPATLKVNPPQAEKGRPPQPGFGPQKVRVYESPEVKNDDRFEEFDRQEKNWLDKVKSIVGEAHYSAYVHMREQSEKEKMMAYKEYHDYLRQKYGDSFSYNISEDQSVREKEITKRYLGQLLKLIGEEKFKQYTAARDQFNEDMRRQNKDSIQVEF